MLKIWKGIEQEGKNTGVLTLFVQSPVILKDDIDIIKKYLIEYDIHRLYIGAGRVDVSYICEEFKQFITDTNVDVAIETSLDCYRLLPEWLITQSEVIVTLRIHNLTNYEFVNSISRDNVSLKIDDYSSICIYEKPYFIRNVNDVSNNLYEGIDTVLYEDE